MSSNYTGLKPGEIAPVSGQYVRKSPYGDFELEVTVVKGEPMPPTPGHGYTYDLVDATKHGDIEDNG